MAESLFDRNRTLIKQTFGLDDSALDMLAFEVGRESRVPKIARHTFLLHGLLAMVTNVLFPLKGMKRRVKVSDEDFVFVSCPDPVFRTKTIGMIAGGLKYVLIYLPNFHINAALQYHNFFKTQGITAFYPTIHVGQVLRVRKKIKCFVRGMVGYDGSTESKRMLFVLSHFAIYNEVVKSYLRQIEGFNGKWILEHEKYYFMPVVIELHNRGEICTMLQHGAFLEKSYNYIPLFCDKVLCCSEREKRIYVENGVGESRVMVFGVPLQTLQLPLERTYTGANQYDLLVLMTAVEDENQDVLQKILRYIKSEYKNVLVRMRPRSRKSDEKRLSDVLQGMEISPVGTSIEEDIARCKKVLSFSEDANIVVVKFNKPFVYIWTPFVYISTERLCEMKSMGNFGTEENYKEEINKLMTQDFYSTFDKDQYNEVLGESDVDELRKRFKEYIKKEC